jgi:hypothetical protein
VSANDELTSVGKENTVGGLSLHFSVSDVEMYETFNGIETFGLYIYRLN